MGNILALIVSVSIKISFWGIFVLAYVAILTVMVSTIVITFNGSVMNDLFYMTQLWLPFNLGTIMLWTVTLITAFITFFIAKKAYELLKELVPVQF